MSSRARRAWLLGLVAAISLGLLWLLFRRIDAARLGALLRSAEPWQLALAVIVALAVNVPLSSRALERALAAHGAPVPPRAALEATLGHLALHAGASFVVGKGARALYLSRAHGVEVKRALRAELTLLGLKVAALLALAAMGTLLQGAGWVLAGVALLVALVFVWGQRRGAAPGALAASFGWALAMGLGQLVVFALALAALGAPLPLASVCAVFPLCLLGAKLPVAWLGLGLREALVVVLFRGSAPPEVLLGASLLFSLIEQLLPGIVGLAFAPRFVVRVVDQVPRQ